MMTIFVTFINKKGGAGKSTTTGNLAAAFARKGYKVLLIDLDPDPDLTDWLLPAEYNGKNSISDAIRLKDLSICVYPSNLENVDIIPSDDEVEATDDQLKTDPLGILILAKLLKKFDTTKYDFVFMDAAPHRTRLASAALTVSDHYIMPVESYFSYKQVPKMIEDAIQIRDTLNPSLTNGFILLNNIEEKTTFGKELVSIQNGPFKDITLTNMIPKNTTIKEAQSKLQSIFDYRPDSISAFAYMYLADELIEKWTGKHD
ncbi:MAG: protochlorophyllide reductase iron-sulfur ATP-binding protein [Candidatus Methanofastidiosum methylothiophilum]|uniref:Protochlorophyllide reductase iron-sulfur ATP-binding protein n=1 Tax=Candidatus Methanofastidiosum methylothiophilum TaxID=1705564 RepID=A0A150IUZ7_9EURY|nr:MAG: protochlorophyllide reductase iron-sulfur ATP-binding protein [Candidatus Methanofastidiosum methylthiophilus]